MKSITALLALTLLLAVASNRCLAEMGIVEVSRERAKELGMEVRFTKNGPNEIWVELEFKPEGKLKDFKHVSLEIRDGGKFLLGYAPLGEKRPKSGSVVVGFLANRAYLDKVSLRVVAGHPMDLTGYELRMKEFVAPAKAR
jgi:hypothetical protein